MDYDYNAFEISKHKQNFFSRRNTAKHLGICVPRLYSIPGTTSHRKLYTTPISQAVLLFVFSQFSHMFHTATTFHFLHLMELPAKYNISCANLRRGEKSPQIQFQQKSGHQEFNICDERRRFLLVTSLFLACPKAKLEGSEAYEMTPHFC